MNKKNLANHLPAFWVASALVWVVLSSLTIPTLKSCQVLSDLPISKGWCEHWEVPCWSTSGHDNMEAGEGLFPCPLESNPTLPGYHNS